MNTVESSLADQLKEVIPRVQLSDVRLIDASVRTRIRDARKARDAHLAMRHGTKVINRSSEGFVIAAMMRADVVKTPGDETDTEKSLISMRVTFALEYRLEGTESFGNEVLEEFARVNGAFNAWPYWREYVQSSAARMNLPPVVLPVFRVSSREEPAEALKPQDSPRAAGQARSSYSRKKR